MKTLTRIETEKLGDHQILATFCLSDGRKWPARFPNAVWGALRNEIHMSVEVIEQ